MHLIYKTPYLSIVDFDPIDLPDFVVLTGVNGSGKSHLLVAIENRNVILEGYEQSKIVRFDYASFRMDNEGTYSGQTLASETEGAWQYFQKQIKGNAAAWRTEIGDNYQILKEECVLNDKSLWSVNTDEITRYRERAKEWFASKKIRDNNLAQSIFVMAKQLPFSIDEIERAEFFQRYKPYGFKNDFLPDQLGKIFWDYYVKLRTNQFNTFQNETAGGNFEVLTDAGFKALHGEKPWEIVNAILKQFDSLNYEVLSPEHLSPFDQYHLQLVHTEKSGLEIEFDSLSSGEKILLALVASVYKASADKHFPEILLLDEVDASLHPSMMKNMLLAIKDVFLDTGVKVILVTHSPTTIALAPEDSIHVMNIAGSQRIVKKSRADALEILTQGYATIEQGLKLFDEVAAENITIVTEGNNTKLIERALQIGKISGVSVLSGVEGVSGKNQLKTLYDFFSRVEHNNKVIFVWDCDVSPSLQAANNTFPYELERNNENDIAKKGIENIFPASLFSSFIKTIILSDGTEKKEFDESRKRDFEKFILKRNDAADFSNFSLLISEVERIKKL